jgi:hypothetical protein
MTATFAKDERTSFCTYDSDCFDSGLKKSGFGVEAMLPPAGSFAG